MTGDTQTIPQPASTTPTEAAAPPTVPAARSAPLARSSAARELGLKRGEFELAVMLGRVRTVADPAGARRRVSRAEIERVRETPGFPESLREGVKAVGTAEGAALLDITQARFTRLARTGVLTPVKFYLNRYRAVVWLYLAEELREFAACEANAPLFTGRAPDTMRAQLASGADLRARNWRRRQMGFLLRQSEDPWERVAVTASFLDPMSLAQLVRDPYERAYLHRLRPQPLTQAAPESPTTHIVERITTADDPDEICWLRANLSLGLAEARRHRPAPRPGRPPVTATPRPHRVPEQPPAPVTGDGAGETDRKEEPRGLLKWLRRRRGRPED
ncbi:DUF6397 family protein [Streptomyces spectabilis]|uniref:Uncharacterized protein n=1 Tax=Streptomyces spectabilis TaxID=68270 RepID=A0A7W8APU0_STRST|nr:DUF6397 family protein [Streptomyces spectabilis]MBB5101811.1 hypothetical protein [Streptomyces spectabilis]MCI3906863.1 DUF6397 family protein [Streptomyces spectabilis]GGV34376.1 hypothetical protein GCM10010245_55200 [Streptomyces spectabilis]